MKTSILLLVLSLFVSSAFASTPGYKCEIILAAEDVKYENATHEFEAPLEGAGHGGGGESFTTGAHEIYVSVDTKWFVVSWSKSGKLIAQTLMLLGNNDMAQGRVVIVYNPQVEGEQVSFSCIAQGFVDLFGQ